MSTLFCAYGVLCSYVLNDVTTFCISHFVCHTEGWNELAVNVMYVNGCCRNYLHSFLLSNEASNEAVCNFGVSSVDIGCRVILSYAY